MTDHENNKKGSPWSLPLIVAAACWPARPRSRWRLPPRLYPPMRWCRARPPRRPRSSIPTTIFAASACSSAPMASCAPALSSIRARCCSPRTASMMCPQPTSMPTTSRPRSRSTSTPCPASRTGSPTTLPAIPRWRCSTSTASSTIRGRFRTRRQQASSRPTSRLPASIPPPPASRPGRCCSPPCPRLTASIRSPAPAITSTSSAMAPPATRRRARWAASISGAARPRTCLAGSYH